MGAQTAGNDVGRDDIDVQINLDVPLHGDQCADDAGDLFFGLGLDRFAAVYLHVIQNHLMKKLELGKELAELCQPIL